MSAGGGGRWIILERHVRAWATDRVLLTLLGMGVLLAGLALRTHIPHTSISLSVKARDVTVRVALDADVRRIDIALGKHASLLLAGFSRIKPTVAACKLDNGEIAGTLTIPTLRLLPGVRLEMRADGAHALDLTITGQAAIQVGAAGSVAVAGRICATNDAGFDIENDPGNEARLRLQTLAGSGESPDLDFYLQGIRVSSLEFGNPDLISSIRSGELRVDDTSETIKLLPADDLTLTGVDKDVQSITFDKGDFAVEFRGRVRGIAVGPSWNRKDLRPTVLEWLSHRSWLTLLFGVVGFLLVTLWKVREWNVKSAPP